MKKLMLLALALVAAPAFAQNTATTTQSGTSNEAFVDQFDALNESTIEQAGSNNDAAIGQGGLDNWGFSAGTNFPYPQLDESRGYAYDNDATIQQDGSGNAAVLMQGAGNDASGATAIATGNVATIIQTGTDNVAAPGQGTYSGEAVDNEFRIDQDGSGHFAVAAQAIQSAYAEGNLSEITQRNGSGNTADTYQGFGATGVAMDNDAFVTQDGSGHTALVNQGRFGFAELSTATVDQFGTGHDATVNQLGTGNTSTVTQND